MIARLIVKCTFHTLSLNMLCQYLFFLEFVPSRILSKFPLATLSLSIHRSSSFDSSVFVRNKQQQQRKQPTLIPSEAVNGCNLILNFRSAEHFLLGKYTSECNDDLIFDCQPENHIRSTKFSLVYIFSIFFT